MSRLPSNRACKITDWAWVKKELILFLQAGFQNDEHFGIIDENAWLKVIHLAEDGIDDPDFGRWGVWENFPSTVERVRLMVLTPEIFNDSERADYGWVRDFPEIVTRIFVRYAVSHGYEPVHSRGTNSNPQIPRRTDLEETEIQWGEFGAKKPNNTRGPPPPPRGPPPGPGGGDGGSKLPPPRGPHGDSGGSFGYGRGGDGRGLGGGYPSGASHGGGNRRDRRAKFEMGPPQDQQQHTVQQQDVENTSAQLEQKQKADQGTQQQNPPQMSCPQQYYPQQQYAYPGGTNFTPYNNGPGHLGMDDTYDMPSHPVYPAPLLSPTYSSGSGSEGSKLRVDAPVFVPASKKEEARGDVA